MACYHPIVGWKDGNGGLTHVKTGVAMRVPCGQCIGCRLEYSRRWAMRCMHEASLHDENCFITLTYRDEELPPYGSLDRRAFPLFMKRLRKRTGEKIRYYHCGEYGDERARPHYHALLFGFNFEDRRQWTVRRGIPVHRSALLEDLWPYGLSEIGTVTFESASYCARYVVKKVTGPAAKEHYARVDPETGEVVQIEPEYSTMSRRPGIGLCWLEKYGEETYRDDTVISRGRPMKPPRYYDEKFAETDPEAVDRVRRARRNKRDFGEGSAKRLAVREECAVARSSLTAREVD